MWTEHRLISFDKTPIFYRRLEPSGPPRAVLILVHGMGEHGGRYRHAAEYFAEAGVECFIPDLRGFGKSGGKRACVNTFLDFHRDLGALHAFVDRSRKESPIFLMGHSFGGLIASSYLAFAGPPTVSGLILSSPIFGIAIPVPPWRHILGILTSYLWPDYTQSNRVKPEMLTHDKKIFERYQEDSLIDQRISAGLYRELVTMIAKKEAIARQITCPVLIQQAGQDFVVSSEAVRDFYRLLKTPDKEIDIYDDFYHEILNEIGRDKVLSRIIRWLLKNLYRK